jgi:hypothetical protein
VGIDGINGTGDDDMDSISGIAGAATFLGMSAAGVAIGAKAAGGTGAAIGGVGGALGGLFAAIMMSQEEPPVALLEAAVFGTMCLGGAIVGARLGGPAGSEGAMAGMMAGGFGGLMASMGGSMMLHEAAKS